MKDCAVTLHDNSVNCPNYNRNLQCTCRCRCCHQMHYQTVNNNLLSPLHRPQMSHGRPEWPQNILYTTHHFYNIRHCMKMYCHYRHCTTRLWGTPCIR